MTRFLTLLNMATGCCLFIILTGCMSTSLRSMGTQPIPAAHQPRKNPNSQDSEIKMSLDGFGMIDNSGFNTKKINAGGAIFGFNYNLGETLSPLFAGIDLGIYGGSVQFDCKRESHCSDSYRAWLASEKGRDNYSFWAITEKVVAGTEFHLPAKIFFGFDGGIRFYQGGGSYDDKRQELELQIPSVKNLDDGYGIAPVTDFWLGYHLGNQGQSGAISLQGSWSKSYQDEHESKIPITLSYFHPSGLHGGVSWAGNTDFSINLGKTFSF